MTIEQRARRVCAVLGWDFSDGAWVNDLVHARAYGHTGRIAVRHHGPGDVLTVTDRDGNVNARATVAALELAATMRDAGDVDIGPCPERGHLDRGGAWDCTTCSKPIDDEAIAAPTGREIVPACLAVILASKSVCTCVVSRRSVGYAGADEDCDDCYGDGFLGGHGGARDALADLAAQWREHLPVLADWMLEHGEIGPVAMADLRGWQTDVVREAQTVAAFGDALGGSKGQPASAEVHRWLTERWTWWAYGRSACPHVPAILTERPGVVRWIDEMLEGGGGGPGTSPSIEVLMMFDQQTEECAHCRVAGTIGADGPRVRRHLPCQHCNGLGRVRGDA